MSRARRQERLHKQAMRDAAVDPFRVATISRDYRADMPAERREQLDLEWLAAETDPRWKGNDAETIARANREWETMK